MKRVALTIALVAVPIFADDIHLQGGGRLSGEIVEQTEESVTIDIGAGQATVKMSTVVGIDKGSSPLREYRERAAAIADSDVEAWRDLGRWAESQGLGVQSREAYAKIAAVIPDDAEANRALGRVLHDGTWMSEEESYVARGYVEFEGEWMTPRERDSIVQERNAREAADRQALAGEIKASEAERRERESREEAAEKARHDELFLEGSLPQLGDPVYWGYGFGPAYWPVAPGSSGGEE